MKKTKILLVGSLLLGTIIFSQGLSETKKVSAAEGDTYELVTNVSTLSVGDTLVIASNTKGVTLGALSGEIFTAVESTFSTDKSKITDLKTGLEFTLGGEKDKWDFTYNNKKVGVTAAKTVAFDKGTTTWKISINTSNNATIQSTTTSYGKFLYNVNNPRFTTYTSKPNTGMLLPQLYRKVVDLSVKHDVNFITNCDTKLESKKIAEGAEITLPTEELIKDGYILEGWYTDSEFKNKFVEGTKMGTQDVTLYANWILDTSAKYTVKFMLNDGTESVYTSVIVKENETIEAPTTPTREGFKFTTWYTNIDLTEEFNFSTKITSDLTLYAGWEEKTTITDIITVDCISATSASYKDFTYTSKLTNIVYSGSASKNNGIQLNPSKNTGIVTTKSNYKIKTVSVKWASESYTGNELSIYASNTSYENISDLYDYKDPIASITKDGEQEFNFNEDYNYIGIRPKGKYVILDSISFEWELDKSKPTIDSTILTTNYLCSILEMNNNISNAIRFIGSVNETKFADLQKVGFNFTLNNTTTKEYNTELSKLYHIIDDTDKKFETESDEIYVKNGYLNYSLILNNIPDDFAGTITYYAFATINDVNYQTEAITIKLVNGTESK